jgi:hypothetical protein
MKKAFVLTHLGLGDNIACNGLVHFISDNYDDVIVVCKQKNMDNVKLLYSNNNKVRIFPIKNDNMISPRYGFNFEIFKRITKDFDIFLAGLHKLDNSPNDFTIFPLNFYQDFNISNDIFWLYSKIPDTNESTQLYNKISENNIDNYVILHNSTSFGKLFNTKLVEDMIGKTKDEILFINLNENEYDKTHRFYNLAQVFILKPLIHCKDIIKNASYVYLTDSSIWCMSIHIDIKTKNCYYISRSNVEYDHIYSLKYISQSTLDFINTNRQVFKQIKI